MVHQLTDDNTKPMQGVGKHATITTQATTVVKAVAGILHGIDFTATASGKIEIFDDTVATGTAIRTISSPSTLLQNEVSKSLGIVFDNGITIKTSGANQDIIVWYS
jgi:hypothetical protein